MRTAVSELVTTLDDRISQRLREQDQLSPRRSADPQTAAAGATQGSNNSTTSGMLRTNTGNIGLPVGGIAPSIMPLPVFSSPGGAASSPRASTVPPTASTTGGTLSPSSAVASVMPAPPQLPSSEAIMVGGSSPPVPRKIAEKIWKLEYVDLNELLPSRLGAPELTMLDLFTQRDRAKESKKIQTFEQWVACFNTLVSVMAARYPDRVKDMLAYSSLIAKAHADYEGTEWLSYDNHFRHAAAAKQLKDWSEVDPSLWTLCFAQAKPRNHPTDQEPKTTLQAMQSPQSMRSKVNSDQRGHTRYHPYERQPICKKWNTSGCRSPTCRFEHICLECHSHTHRLSECTVSKGKMRADPQREQKASFRAH